MASLLKFKRGLESVINQYILELAEPIFSSDTHKLFVGDNIIPGGYLIGGESISYGDGYPIIYIQTNYDLSPFILYAVSTINGIITLTLPEDPPIGSEIRIIDRSNNFNVNKVILNGNGSRIEGSLNNYDLTENGAYILCYGLNGEEETWFVIPVSGEKWFDSGTEDGWNIRYVDANTVVVNKESLLVDTTNNAVGVNVQSSVTLGYKFQLQDYNNTWGVNKVTLNLVNPDHTFKCGETKTLEFNENGLVVTCIYDVCPDGGFSWSVKVGRNLIPQDSNIDNWFPNGAEDGDIIVWNSNLEKWVLGDPIITDFDLSFYYPAEDGQILVYNSAEESWEVTDVEKTFGWFYSAEDGQLLVYNDSLNDWEGKDIINILNDFFPGTESDQLLVYSDSLSAWEVKRLDHSELTGASGSDHTTATGPTPIVFKAIQSDSEGHIIGLTTKQLNANFVTSSHLTNPYPIHGNPEVKYAGATHYHPQYSGYQLVAHSHTHNGLGGVNGIGTSWSNGGSPYKFIRFLGIDPYGHN